MNEKKEDGRRRPADENKRRVLHPLSSTVAVYAHPSSSSSSSSPPSSSSPELSTSPSSSPPPIYHLSRRSPVYCTRGCVATSQPLATSIGLHVLRGLGGNAADASVAVAAALSVLEPCSTGLGGDMFALWYDASTSVVSAVNGSGRSPAASSIRDVERAHSSSCSSSSSSTSVKEEELHSHFRRGVHSVTVPGAAMGWQDVHAKFGSGRLSLLELLEPAIELAEGGFPVAPLTSFAWRSQMDSLTRWYTEEEIVGGGEVEMSVDGRGAGPMPGELFRNPGLAGVLRSLGVRGAWDGFYGGFPGRAIVEAVRKHGGVMTMDDMANHASTFPEPIRVEYRGVHVWEVPPNGQGVAGLIALEGLRSLEEGGIVDSPPPSSSSSREDDCVVSSTGSGSTHRHHPQPSCEMLHAQIEMMRLGFGDARAHVCDPDFVVREESTTCWLLNKERIEKRAVELFDKERAAIHGGPDSTSCTVSFQVVDGEGNAMSFVNSNYMGFGTGLTPANCGFTLQNRGAGFSLDPSHPNALEPNKRPYHTIIPAMLTHADTGELYATLTNMGGFMQPQGHMQLVVNLLAYGMDPQTAIDAPRFCIGDGTMNGTVFLEEGFHPNTIAKLKSMGHNMKADVSGHERDWFGRAQIIRRDRGSGVLCAGSDGRADGCALGY